MKKFARFTFLFIGVALFALPSFAQVAIPISNAAVTGTILNNTAVINSSGNAIVATISNTTVPTYIVASNSGTTGQAQLAVLGQALCVMDSTVSGSAAWYYVINSTTVGGACHPQLLAPSAGTWVIGYLSSASTTAGQPALVNVNSFIYGGAGMATSSGSVNNGNYRQFSVFPATGNAVGPTPNLYNIDSSMSLSQINSMISGLNCGACNGTYNTVLVGDGVAFQPWTNTPQGFPAGNPGVGFHDFRTGTEYTQMTRWGIVPDAQQILASVSSGSTSITVNTGVVPWQCPNSSFPCASGGDIGKTVSIGGYVGDYYNGTQYRFTPTIVSIQSNSTATLSTPSPATFSNILPWKGTDNCSAFTDAMKGLASGDLTGGLATNGLMGLLPAGYMLTTCPIPWNNSQSWMGLNTADAFIVGTPATDVVQTSSVNGSGLNWGRMTLIPDGSISASQHPYTNVDKNGTVTTVQPFYRPLHVGNFSDANNPKGPGFCATCDGSYVANITQNSNKICVPNGLGRVPQIGDEGMFPYTPTIFQTSVTGNTGTTCGAGFTDVTISPAIPNTTGYTLTQTPFYASLGAAGIQHLSVAIPAGTMTYPYSMCVANPTTPIPGFISNVAQHGSLRVGSEFYDYLGVTFGSPYCFTLRAGPSTSAGWAIGTPIAPMNPCYADHLTPYPVTPSVNSNDATPSGAVYFPGLCGGNFGLSSPDLDGATDTGGSFFRAHLEDVQINPTNVNPGKGVGGYYLAGNHAPYATWLTKWGIYGGDFGFAQGPASKNEWNIGSVGPTGDGLHLGDWSITSAYGISIIGQQNSTIDRVDGYSTEYSPFDGTPIGATTVLSLGYTLSELNGNGVQGCGDITGININFEPENGSHLDYPAGVEINCNGNVFKGNSFEGAGMIIGGSNNTIDGQQLSAAANNPLIIYGDNNTIRDTIETATGKVSNTYGIGSVLNWGQNNTMGVGSAYGSGQTIAPAPGLREPTTGYDSGSFRDGLAATPYVTDKESFFSPKEFGPGVTQGVDPSPFQVGPVVDPTAPISGSYVGCYIGSSYGCTPFHIGGFFGYYYIGQDNRVAAIPYVLTTALKTTSNQTFNLQVNAQDPGNANDTCGGAAQIVNQSVTTVGGQWTTVMYPANFTGHTGCILQFVFQYSTTADTMEVAYMDFQPVPKSSFLATVSSSIEGTTCNVAALLGTDGSYIYVCDGAHVKRAPIS